MAKEMVFNGTAFALIIGYYGIINVLMFALMCYDKNAAIKKRYRIPEKNLYLMAVLGSGFGGLIGMVFKHHKIRHIDFILVFTITAILHFLVIYFLVGKFAITFV